MVVTASAASAAAAACSSAHAHDGVLDTQAPEVSGLAGGLTLRGVHSGLVREEASEMSAVLQSESHLSGNAVMEAQNIRGSCITSPEGAGRERPGGCGMCMVGGNLAIVERKSNGEVFGLACALHRVMEIGAHLGSTGAIATRVGGRLVEERWFEMDR
mmetsp:Transcript_13179/g.39542  ORF Transcript_13179/g.39542 Transcript_13179/m.39542 type:complete len:158 (-) Transcript_13179:49-522(-)